MLGFFKAARESAASALCTGQSPMETRRLRQDIEQTRWAIDTARNHFEQAVEPTLIDCYIYEWNAAQLRYQFLLRKFKSQGG